MQKQVVKISPVGLMGGGMEGPDPWTPPPPPTALSNRVRELFFLKMFLRPQLG